MNRPARQTVISPIAIKCRRYILNCIGFFAAIIDFAEQLFDCFRASVYLILNLNGRGKIGGGDWRSGRSEPIQASHP